MWNARTSGPTSLNGASQLCYLKTLHTTQTALAHTKLTATPQKSGPPGSGPGAESPTTAQPIEFDDDEQELGVINNDGTDTPTAKRTGSTLQPHQQNHQKPSVEQEGGGGLGSEEAPPAKPPRPVSPQQQAEATLIEAFPDTDPKVIKAVLMASGGKVEPAFNALLGLWLDCTLENTGS